MSPPAASRELETLRWQFAMTWSLARHHLPALTDEACLWEPAPGSWTVRRGEDGLWRPDFSETEPDPAPPVTIGWLTWHLAWWWSGARSAVEGRTPPARETVFWEGDAARAVARLESLSLVWGAMLSDLNDAALARPTAFPWTEPRPLATTLAWVNSELMKNVAEIGVVRHLYEASRGLR